ncbi:MAG: hypothetical protein AAFV90_14960 [Cyanobacteria bacterium J06634_5]
MAESSQESFDSGTVGDSGSVGDSATMGQGPYEKVTLAEGPSGLPPSVAAHLLKLATQGRSLAYFQLTPAGQLISWGGELARYGLSRLKVGDDITQYLFFLEGLFPLCQAHEVLPGLQINAAIVLDVHLLREAACGWVILLDTTADLEVQQQLQQQGNDLSLLKEKYAKLLNWPVSWLYTSKTITPQRQLMSSPRPVSVLLVKVFGAEINGTDSLQTLDTAFAVISQITDKAEGIMHHVLGQSAVAIFGLRPSESPPAVQALLAAKQLIVEHSSTMGIAITTGNAITGVIHFHGLKMPNPVGAQVQQILSLSHRVRTGAIIVDPITFEAFDNRAAAGNATHSDFQVQPFKAHHDPPDIPAKGVDLYELTLG